MTLFIEYCYKPILRIGEDIGEWFIPKGPRFKNLLRGMHMHMDDADKMGMENFEELLTCLTRNSLEPNAHLHHKLKRKGCQKPFTKGIAVASFAKVAHQSKCIDMVLGDDDEKEGGRRGRKANSFGYALVKELKNGIKGMGRADSIAHVMAKLKTSEYGPALILRVRRTPPGAPPE